MTPVVVRNRPATDGLIPAGSPAPKPLTVVDAARQELAARLGLHQGRLRSINPRWGQLLKAGAKIDLHISRARFETTLDWKEMGIVPASEAEARAMDAVIVPGRRLQVPEHWPSSPELTDSGPIQDLDHVDDAARQYLKKHAHRFPWGWMVAEGNAECPDHGRLEPGALLAEHLEQAHPAVYASYVAALGEAFGDQALDGLDPEAVADFNASYPTKLAFGGKERGWHFTETMRALQDYAAKYEAVGQRIVDEYDELDVATRKHHTVIGFQNYERMRAQAERNGTLQSFEKTYGDVETFMHAYVERAMAGKPSVELVAALCRFEIDVQHVPLASEMELDRLKTAETRAATVVVETEARVARAKEAARIRVETAQDRVTAESLEAEGRVLAAGTAARVQEAQRVEREVAATRLRLATEMERTIAAQTQQRLESEVFSFVDQLRKNLRDQVYSTTVDALAALKTNDKLPAGSVKGVRNLLDTVARLDFYNEPDLQKKIAQVTGMLDGKAVDRDDKAIGAKLREIAAESRLILIDLGATPKRSAAEFGVPDDVDGLFTELARPRGQATLDDSVVLVTEGRGARPEAALAL